MRVKTFLLAGLVTTAVSLLTLPTGVQAENLLSLLKGRYSRHFANANVSGEEYESDDVVEIVPVGNNAAYVRAELAFFNGHMCSISGVGQVEGERIVYDDHQVALPDAPPCVLTVARQGNELRLDDGAMSCKHYCGARGSLGGAALPFSSRRPISYLGRLKASREYMEAIRIWQSQRNR